MTLRELHEELTRLLDDDGPDGALGDTEVLMTANYGDISNNEECYHIRCVAITVATRPSGADEASMITHL